MNTLTRFVTRIYAGLLRVYPRDFRSAFGDEMQSVFGAAAAEAAAQGALALWVLLWRELRDVPRHALRERWRSVVAGKGEAMSDELTGMNYSRGKPRGIQQPKEKAYAASRVGSDPTRLNS